MRRIAACKRSRGRSSVVALAPLLDIAGLLVALGLIVVATLLVGALFEIAQSGIGWVPWLGGKAKAKLVVIEQRINNRMNRAAAGLEARIGETWHTLAAIVEETGTAIWEVAKAAAHIEWLIRVKYPLAAWKYALAHAQRGLKVIERKGDVIIRRETISRKALKAAVAAAVAAALHAKHYAVSVGHAIPNPFPRIRRAEKRLDNQAKRLTKLERATIGTAAAAVTLTALKRIGLGWLKCEKVNRTGKALCGMDPRTFESLLLDLSVLTVAFNIETFAKELQAVTHEAAKLITDFAE